MSAENCIITKARGNGIQHEGKAGEAGIYPGHLLETSAARTFLRLNNAASVGAPILVALENMYLTPGTVDTVYAVNDNVYACAVSNGMEFQARLAPSAAAIVVGDQVVSDGDGGVKKAGAAEEVIGEALEAVDNSANAATSVRLKIRAR